MNKINVKVIELKDLDLNNMVPCTYYGFDMNNDTIIDLYFEKIRDIHAFPGEGCIILKIERE